jgi:BirA family biotin operon repressor/biotin-[acetyl-CoA-carboxylase] ligase
MFDLPRIAASGLVAQLDFHESLGSTSDRALELAARGDPQLPLLVLAERQTAGRGRGTNRWWATEGALTFSLVQGAPEAKLVPLRWPQWSLVAGLAVCQALQELVPRGDWRVKWPNDVFVNGGKVCGILCELVPGSKDRLAIGIGVNINNSLAAAPEEIQRSARTLIDLDGQRRKMTAVLLAILDKLDEGWTRLARESFAGLASAYRERCFLTDKALTIVSGGETIIGRCRGVDDAGALVLQTEAGLRPVISGTIQSWE